MLSFSAAATHVNKLVAPVLTSRWLSPLVRRWMTTVTYTGRRSGRVISTPVGYKRHGDDVVEIPVMLPDKKAWWRNFTGDGAPLTLVLDGSPRSGHGVATRDARGGVRVTVRFPPV
ncbi:nitroreductase/quinone reductase family protein [Kineococcus radiotolerans]|uniref:DUF385 domain-containing protein n=1 Tax=Kineococcus radiotolerans (strain ATCC BAA-149 / DSM 14245 / SRS30216) TaxID=266940 RepID=A6WB80_KINRD|nr:hypothetical protein Krad_2595 [Kineococcus radiotolerans SRS30216 = ATCC BAA-149]